MNIDEFSFQERENIFNKLSSVLEKVTGDTDGAKINRIEKNKTRFLVKVWHNTATKAVNAALKSFSRSRTPFTEIDQDRVVSVLTEEFSSYPEQVAERVKNDLEEIYKVNKTRFAQQFELRPNENLVMFKTFSFNELQKKVVPHTIKVKSFANIEKVDRSIQAPLGEEDELIYENLARLENVAIEEHFSKTLTPKVIAAIQASIIAKGLNNREARVFLEQELTKIVGGNLAESSPASIRVGQKAVSDYFTGLSATNVTFTRNFGQLQMLDEAGFREYVFVAVVDNRTSQICLQMNGRVFRVEDGIRNMNRVLAVESIEELKSVAPFTRNLNEFGVGANERLQDEALSSQLAAAGISWPPLHFRCYDDKTEVYTRKGFILFKDVNPGDECLSLNPETKDLEWVTVDQTQKKKHTGKMLLLTNDQHSLDMLVTPDHTMFYYKRTDHGKKRTIDPYFESITQFLSSGSEAKLYLSSKWKGKTAGIVDISGFKMREDHFCEFMGYYLSDGSAYGSRKTDKHSYVHIAQKDGQDKMYRRLIKMGLKGLTRTKEKLHVYDRRLGDYCAKFGKSHERYVPEIIKEMSSDNIRIFLNAFNSCDGHIQKTNNFKNGNFKDLKKYFTTSKRMADDIGELLIKSGKSVSYKLDHRAGTQQKFRNGVYTINHDLWVICEINSEFRKCRKVEEVDYDGFVYDVTLQKNHTILTRRNGKVVWGSNCRSSIEPR